MVVICETCFRRCSLAEGQTGFCRARVNRGGSVVPLAYGRISSIALDPIEKKPLARFMPGSRVLSVGGWGCNMRCAFCQNYGISQRGPAGGDGPLSSDAAGPQGESGQAGGGSGSCDGSGRESDGMLLSPEELCAEALALRSRGSIGVAYTYNEPLVAWEYVRDCARLLHQAGMKNVIVTNGCVLSSVLEELLPYTDALNIDLKCFSDASYRALGGDFESVRQTIARCHAAGCHVELTTLIVPGFNDGEAELAAEAAWIASLDRTIPLHLTRFFPRWQLSDLPPTPLDSLYRLVALARRELTDVVPGNV